MSLNILHLHRESVFPPSDGGEVRAWKTADRLADNGTVWFAQPCANNHVYDNGVRTIDIGNPIMQTKYGRIYLWNASLAAGPYFNEHQTKYTVDTLRQHPTTFDLVVCESPQMIRASQELADYNNAELLVNFHNSMYELLDQQLRSRHVPSVLRQRAVNRLERLEHSAIDAASIVVFQSEDDVAHYDLPEDTLVSVIPNGCEYDQIANGGEPTQVKESLGIQDDETICVFVGAYDYEPNKRAANLICDTIAPELSEFTFVLAGRNPPDTTSMNVLTPGFVSDLPGLLSAADVALCPLTMGSGTKLKMVDYLAAGIPIVTTPVGAQGLPIKDEQHAIIVDQPEAFPEAIRRIERSPDMQESLGRNAASLGMEYDWDRLLSEYDELLNELYNRPTILNNR
ncbi:Glycosyltransferase involved in cell wall bisynthesis [Haloarcula vallismortis]|uniref:Glycosyltransferase involved in cell wall bisynthesis n=2 Tax=Haloarcula vallismortis TaxID=28442 RepID=A0A1H2ZD05_HALVA|nr:Glycosyltransferase involved in cell wall bisynthesis [Haloarcula vallismortis]